MSPVNRAGSVSEISPRHSPRHSPKCRCVHMRRRVGPVTEISITGLEIFPYEHSSPVTGMKFERSRLVHLGNLAEISHMNRNRAEILLRQAG